MFVPFAKYYFTNTSRIKSKYFWAVFKGLTSFPARMVDVFLLRRKAADGLSQTLFQQADALWEVKHVGISLWWNHGWSHPPRSQAQHSVGEGVGNKRRRPTALASLANGHLSSGVRGSWGYPQRHREVKWVTMFEVRPAVIAPNIQQMSGRPHR